MKIMRIKNYCLLLIGILLLILNATNIIAIEISTQVESTSNPKIVKAERDTKTGITTIQGQADPGSKLVVTLDDDTIIKVDTPKNGEFKITLNDFTNDNVKMIATCENKLDSESIKVDIKDKNYMNNDNDKELKKIIDSLTTNKVEDNTKINSKTLTNINSNNNSKSFSSSTKTNIKNNEKGVEIPKFPNNSGIIDTEGVFNNRSSNNSEDDIRFPNKLYGKKSSVSSNNTNSNNSSDYKRLTGQPTSPSKARATVTENVSNTNKPYPIYHGLNGNSKKTSNVNYAADARQFITFETKNGKTFHLVINHDEKSENVMLLTEVSEDDLLNMVERKELVKTEVKVEEQAKEVSKVPVKQEEKSELGTYLVIGLVAAVGVLGAYFFKKHKKEEADNLASFEEIDDIDDNELDEIDDIDEIITDDKANIKENTISISDHNSENELIKDDQDNDKYMSSEFDALDQNLENDEDNY